ncbi:MAG: 1-deoxy-D-xylulose-5-phosphate synthase [Ferrovum sp. 37-45-19]|uniref:1-deoxy-D-xylulose-5-phosphate synthase n=1 Tax=Ferrovum sp. JA12 TaxID=1356299 RepID=UPI0007024E10|nr:1-deoxy-D-xylulose-5-phosphate synthase [Ferrovum sp. JA12]OYV80576.1 MAG: 1-deoxy-D-xylulose-5-phosphate synthase [Ferrovum sp. 21-44-67]OYV94892.1 MAG: 1-deoxy-D-xylulose-5-phosphate synthase [Ferrovum sp. 37-45-19]HQT80973.1 1-deoxy-D-xylulose-5-phosphate synthase [Ferrovaceae bacterium]KRH79302.1 1-deoxy-D-xylulose-5-phosphate synthase [Ferrovum sp. JA12]HQU06210.1 1-deoxy-D-xylulose-5-phosphate synthase [Ferrovaceae bacterium]
MTTFTPTPLLDTVNWPHQLRALGREQLTDLTKELRQFVLESVASTGGHLSSNLGTIELTVALHWVFNTPDDRLIFDVGHQTYAHKILTGRREGMKQLRIKGGMSGFPKRSESEYDAFGTAHSSTSISAALGMATAFKQLGLSRKVVAVIGDGALTGGMAFEAMNNARNTGSDLIVILNDNEMSISRPVGALSNYLARIMSGRVYNSVRKQSEKVLGVAPPILEMAKRWEEHFKGFMNPPATLFEEFGFNYIGPIDGHNLDTLVSTLTNVKRLSGPQFLHIITKKGKGYEPAELDPILYHGVTPFDPAVGITQQPSTKLSYTQIFGEWLCDMAEHDSRLVGITPAMCEGSGLVEFSKQYPERYFDVGIAEQHALTFAAGLAAEGLKPIVAIYSTFLQRAYDQLIHDIALQNLPVTFAIDRAGLVGADGATHCGSFDLTYLRCLPNMVVMAPADENECRKMLTTAYYHQGPAAVRYPRGSGPGEKIVKDFETLEIGRAEIRRQGKYVVILAFGSVLGPALQAGQELNATVVNMRFIKPLDESLILAMALNHQLLVTVEENVIQGGAGSAIAEVLATHALAIPLLQLGLPDKWIDQGDPKLLLQEVGLDAKGLLNAIEARLSSLQLRRSGT